jgi:hypothetical protein
MSSVVGYLPDSNDVSTEAEESLLLRFVTRMWLVKTEKTKYVLVICKVWKSVIAL